MSGNPGPFIVRKARPTDSDGLYDVCLKTGNAGEDATAQFPNDPQALGRLYSNPYLKYEPDFAFVLEDSEGVCGYTLAAIDTVSFNNKMTTEYMPEVCAKYPHPASDAGGKHTDPSTWTREQQMYATYHEWSASEPEILLELYPSHLHIDIIARGQGQGNGKKLISTLLDALRAAGSRGVMLGMSPRNLRAYGFYKKMGFHEIGRADDDVWMGMRFIETPLPPLPPSTFAAGVIEGFYGRPWSPDQRLELVDNMSSWGLNMYMYSPKDDRKHRAAWRELYDGSECAHLSSLITACKAKGVWFVYGIAPGLDMVHSDIKDQSLLKQKLAQLYGLGVRNFAFLFDDIPGKLHEEDNRKFTTIASAQAAVANTCALFLLDMMIQSNDPLKGTVPCQFMFCPVEYCGRLSSPDVVSSPYLNELGRLLIPEIKVLWTGPAVISKTITVADVSEIGAVLRRQIVIWDNLHANDYDNGRRMFLGPFSGRDAELPKCGWVAGILSNPNCEYEANFAPLRTLSLYTKAASATPPFPYDPRTAFLQACEEWLPRFNSGGTPIFTIDDVVTIGDMLYLPFQHGTTAAEFLSLAKSVITDKDPSQLPRLLECGDAIERAFRRLTEMHHRELCFTLYRFMWDAKEESDVITKFAQWLHSPAANEQGVASPYAVPGPIRGGFIAHCQRIVTFDDETGLFRLPKYEAK